jgi:hypothetical protein
MITMVCQLSQCIVHGGVDISATYADIDKLIHRRAGLTGDTLETHAPASQMNNDPAMALRRDPSFDSYDGAGQSLQGGSKLVCVQHAFTTPGTALERVVWIRRKRLRIDRVYSSYFACGMMVMMPIRRMGRCLHAQSRRIGAVKFARCFQTRSQIRPASQQLHRHAGVRGFKHGHASKLRIQTRAHGTQPGGID